MEITSTQNTVTETLHDMISAAPKSTSDKVNTSQRHKFALWDLSLTHIPKQDGRLLTWRTVRNKFEASKKFHFSALVFVIIYLTFLIKHLWQHCQFEKRYDLQEHKGINIQHSLSTTQITRVLFFHSKMVKVSPEFSTEKGFFHPNVSSINICMPHNFNNPTTKTW